MHQRQVCQQDLALIIQSRGQGSGRPEIKHTRTVCAQAAFVARGVNLTLNPLFLLQARQTPQAYLGKRVGGEVIGSETLCPFLPDFRQQSDLHEHRRHP